MFIENLINNASKKLKEKKFSTFRLDAELMLSSIMKVSREKLLVNDKLRLDKKIINKYNVALERRLKKEPIAYINKKKEFWSLDFYVDKNTLIPRPETELMVFAVLNSFKNKDINILDIGTGSGCILLSILTELKFSRGIGIDVSKRSIRNAKLNSKKFNLENRSKFIIASIKDFNLGHYDLIVSNPPYISTNNINKLSKEIVNFEPIIALNGGIDGLDLIKKVIYNSRKLLKVNGILAIEIGTNQYLEVSKLLNKNGFRIVHKINDFQKNVRCILSTKV
tara:strand:- start:1701 stop:2540 length:840 start_codon:yes stop_codon:yes gene_type:complete